MTAFSLSSSPLFVNVVIYLHMCIHLTNSNIDDSLQLGLLPRRLSSSIQYLLETK